MATPDRSKWTWWGLQRVGIEGVKRWRIGPLSLWAQRLEGEWRLAWASTGDSMEDTLSPMEAAEVDDFLGLENATRYASQGKNDQLWLTARLADRPMVTQSEKPVSLPPDEELYIYVSTPLWVEVAVGQERKKLAEVPVYRPSDTWFGANTLEGELCYSSRTFHRLSLDNVPVKPHRAITAVLVQNRARELLTLERMKIPVPNLALCQTDDGRLWTQEVVFERTEDTEFAALHMPSRSDRRCVHAGQRGELVSEPREPMTESLVTRAFSSLFRMQG